MEIVATRTVAAPLSRSGRPEPAQHEDLPGPAGSAMSAMTTVPPTMARRSIGRLP